MLAKAVGLAQRIVLLLPPPLRQRAVQSVGRLDVDTTGLLLLTDDGGLIHRFTSPKRHLPKVYEVTVADALAGDEAAKLRAGVLLDDDPRPTIADDCQATGSHSLRMSLTEGRYHQVKRMLGALGHRARHCTAASLARCNCPPTCLPANGAGCPAPK